MIAINKLSQSNPVKNEFDCDGRIVLITGKPKIWKKLTDAASNYLQWLAAIALRVVPKAIAKLGQQTEYGFVLEPYLQVFERKPKVETISAVGTAS